jgi:hypothetical protein
VSLNFNKNNKIIGITYILQSMWKPGYYVEWTELVSDYFERSPM